MATDAVDLEFLGQRVTDLIELASDHLSLVS
jgi:hypothetical protein